MYRIVLVLFIIGVEGKVIGRSASGGLVNCDTNSKQNSIYFYQQQNTSREGAVHTKNEPFKNLQETSRNTDGTSGRKKKKKDTFYEILPMLIIPYLVQSGILPMMLMSIKFMLIKTLFVGKLALILIAINAFRSRYDNQNSMQHLMVKHYGYNGGDEYGAYVNY